jgi:hypothetical protein
MKNSKIKYAEKDTLPAKIDPKDVSIRISMVIEGDLLDALKAEAERQKRPYQTIMKEILREKIMAQAIRGDSLEARVERIEAVLSTAIKGRKRAVSVKGPSAKKTAG